MMSKPPEQLEALPSLKLGDPITLPNGAKYAITAIISSIVLDEEEDGSPVLIFECVGSLLTMQGGN